LLSDPRALLNAGADCDGHQGPNNAIDRSTTAGVRRIRNGDAASEHSVVTQGCKVAECDQVANDSTRSDGDIVSDPDGVPEAPAICDSQSCARYNSASYGDICAKNVVHTELCTATNDRVGPDRNGVATMCHASSEGCA
jgi:hypothetical protein